MAEDDEIDEIYVPPLEGMYLFFSFFQIPIIILESTSLTNK